MCYKAQKAPPVQAAPTRADAQDTVTAQRKQLAEQSGTTGNIFTSALGDSSYGQNVQKLAKLGAVSA